MRQQEGEGEMNHSRKMFAVGVLAMAVGLTAGVSDVWALSEQQTAVHSQAVAAIKAATADLESARSSAGTTARPATGSRLRLTQTRLESATQRLKQAAEALRQLPSDDDAVQPTLQAYSQALETAKTIQTIITQPAQDTRTQGEASSDKSDDAASSSESGTAKSDARPASTSEQKKAGDSPKLHYQQEDLLRQARFNMREVTGGINRAQETLKKMDDAGASVVHSEIVAALGHVNTAQGKLKEAMDALAQLPAEHEQVAPVIREAQNAQAALGAMKSRLEAQEKAQGSKASADNYENYGRDLVLLQEFGRRYGNFQQLSQEQPEQLAQVIREDGHVQREVQRIARTYLPLVEQKTEAGARMEGVFNHYQSQRNAFAQQLMAYREALPAQFDADLQSARALAQQAVQNRKPAFFNPDGGVEQQLGFAKQKLGVVEAFGAEAAKPFQQKYDAVRQEIAASAKTLEQDIINSNVLPGDVYKGEDRDAIVAVARDAWSHQQKDAKVLKVVIPAQAWKRETKWVWRRDAFHKVDQSRIQAQLVIQYNDRLAVVQPVNVVRDHLSGDAMIGSPLREGSEAVPAHATLLLDKVK